MNSAPDRKKVTTKTNEIAVEMSVRVLRALKDYGIDPAATANSDLDTASAAVKILRAIGDDINLRLSPTTWRDVVAKAKKSAQI